MLRSLVLAVAQQPQVKGLLTTGPGKALARRFVAGESLEDALRVTKRLTAAGAKVSLDFLGESVGSVKEAEAAASVYHETIGALKRQELAASLSIKPSQFGIDLDAQRCRALVAGVAADAATLPATLRLDMESSAYTERTLALWRDLHDEHPNIGIVLQAALRRTAGDLAQTIAEGASIRLCKGAYAEPPHIAFPRKADVDAAFERLMRVLLKAAGELPVIVSGNEPRAALATHDQKLVLVALAIAHQLGLSAKQYEFQMLYGVRRELQSRLASAGEPLRIYVPWGPAWYPYLSRRLAERPANLAFVGRALLADLRAGHLP